MNFIIRLAEAPEIVVDRKRFPAVDRRTLAVVIALPQHIDRIAKGLQGAFVLFKVDDVSADFSIGLAQGKGVDRYNKRRSCYSGQKFSARLHCMPPRKIEQSGIDRGYQSHITRASFELKRPSHAQ
ncbi:hypothetical protein RPMA_09405 [Tardiphaga alba]|uniref:Uncharacterized protein n=1 Tax=Tardiphaga alba TaxID=340268 RepID=A0ABX8A712_9BRAD|nr:hypothetical protein [Tardiphaga alba]QUS39022.1 hypothetical protein RPMA_09405 [Tardiphaga alba]